MSCPVDADTRSAWLALQAQARAVRPDAPAPPPARSNDQARAHAFLALRGMSQGPRPRATSPPATGAPHTDMAAHEGLSLEREVSSIPRARTTALPAATGGSHAMADAAGEQDDKWVYPSPAQFYAALARKHSDNPAAVADMDVVVPLHNAVNERTWAQIRGWERQFHPECLFNGGLKLTTFEGKAQETSWRAWFSSLAGYTKPFDRHDWTVDRCGQSVRYIIDYYAGAPSENGGVSFYLDVRPAPDSVGNLLMRFWRAARGTPPDQLTA